MRHEVQSAIRIDTTFETVEIRDHDNQIWPMFPSKLNFSGKLV